MKKFLYISTTGRLERPYLDPSVRYRCYHPAEDLTMKGYVADVIAFHAFEVDMIKHYDIFVFHRPPYDPKLEMALALLEKYGKIYFADYDDLIFAPEHALQSSIYLTGRADKNKTLEIFRKNYKAMKWFKNFTVSTEPLKKILLKLNPSADVSVIHNGLSSSWLSRVKNFAATPESRIKRISYLSGTKSHDHDFAVVTDVLKNELKCKEQLELMIVGPLEYNRESFGNKLFHLNYVEYKNLPQLIAKSWLNIAPLQENIFNRCKSGLKFFESGAFGIPSIVSPMPDFERFGEAVIIAKTETDWQIQLDKLYNDESHYRQKSIEVRQYTLNNCRSVRETEKFLDLLKG